MSGCLFDTNVWIAAVFTTHPAHDAAQAALAEVTPDVDELKSPALYFGTTTGQLWLGRDGGEDWECLFDALPPIHCVKVSAV